MSALPMRIAAAAASEPVEPGTPVLLSHNAGAVTARAVS